MHDKLKFFLFSIILLLSCSVNKEGIKGDFRVNIRLSSDPGRINPMFAGSSAVAREVYPYVFLQLGEYNPVNYKLEPILAKTLPEVNKIEEGEYKGGIRFDFELLEEAVWTDGAPITGSDYLFTLKVTNHPLVDAGTWRSILNDIVSVDIDTENPKKFSVVFAEEYILAIEAAMSFEILPQHIYDPEGVLSKLTLNELKNEQFISAKAQTDTAFQDFARLYNSLEHNLEICSGSGPYELVDWESNQYILLRKKENWWGNQFKNRPFLNAFPNELLFKIIADETTAITQLKNGSIDVMTVRNGEDFKNLIENETLKDKLTFYTPELMQFYYLGLNNKHVALRDKRLRKALAHLIDVDNIIESMEFGQAKRIIGTIPPYSNAYNSELNPIQLDLNAARSLLSEAGWTDQDGDGLLEKTINGQKIELKLRMFVSQSELGKRIGLLMKENANKVGIEIEIIQKDFRTYYRDNILKSDYEIAALLLRQSLSPFDPYPRWHSDNAVFGGSNLSGFSNIDADRLIEKIQDSTEKTERIQYYLELQKIMYDEQPVIFLYSPVSRIVVSDRFNPLISVKRPGYFVNLFTQKGDPAYSLQ